MGKTTNYEHFIKDVESVDFLSITKRHLVTSLEELDYLLNDKYKDKQFMSFDLETTGLNPEEDILVGFSFAFDGVEGYYVPVNHKEGPNLGEESVKMIYDRMTKLKKTFAYNLMFDFNFLEFEGQLRSKYTYDMDKCSYYDVMVGMFLADTNIPFPSLKKSAKKFLGWNMDKFEATLGDNYNFHYVSPKDAYDYGALDAISTFALAPISLKFYKEAKLSGKIDNDFILPFTRVLRKGIRHDVEYTKQILDEQEKKLKELEMEIYRLAGKEFKIGSPKGLSDVLMSLGIHTGETTKSGYMKTDLEHLANANIKHPHPIRDVLAEYKRLSKVLSTYVRTLYDYAKDEPENRLRYCYHLFRAPCLTEDAIVNIKDKGLVSIKNVEVNDLIWTQYGWKKVLWNRKKWSDDTYKLTLSNGLTLRGTGHHPVLVNTKKRKYSFEPEWAGIETLKEREWVHLNHETPEIQINKIKLPSKIVTERSYRCKDYSIPEYLDEDLARFIGFLDGDGCLKEDRVSLCYNEDEKEMFYYSKYAKAIHNLDYKVKYSLKDKSEQHEIFSIPLSKWYKSLGVRGDGVPKIILQGGRSIWCSYLAGLWDSDGCLSKEDNAHKNKYTPKIKLAKEQTMRDVSYMLHSLGIPNTFSECKSYRKKGCSPQYQVRVTSFQGFALFKQLIASKMINIKKKERANQSSDDYITWSHSLVERVEKLEGAWVYDIEVEEVHEFIANGIVTHNTCRLAAGKDGKNSYFTKVNIQAISKPHSKMWYVHDYKEGDKVNEGDRVVLDWRFSLTDKSDYMIEALDPHWNIRNIYLPEKNHYWVSIDFSAEELRLIANYSKEPLWVSTFLNGGDLHKSMAASIFHKEEKDVTGDERKKAKSANFGLSYGMSPYTMVGRFKLPLKECEELHKGWWGSVPHIKAYQQRTIKQAKATGTVYNYFGRPRRVKHYFRGDRRQQSFGARTCRNSPIQSMGADIFKVAFLKTYKQLLTNPKYKDHCRFLSTIHDELNLSIEYTDRKLFMEMLGIFYKCMYTKIKGWDVPFEVGVEIGTRWGDSFPFNYDPKTEVLEPDMFKVEPKEEKKEEVIQEIDTTQDEEEGDIEIKFDIKF